MSDPLIPEQILLARVNLSHTPHQDCYPEAFWIATVDQLQARLDDAELAIIAARAAYFAQDWDALEANLGVNPDAINPPGRAVAVTDFLAGCDDA